MPIKVGKYFQFVQLWNLQLLCLFDLNQNDDQINSVCGYHRHYHSHSQTLSLQIKAPGVCVMFMLLVSC